jgi:hypothetical protein
VSQPAPELRDEAAREAAWALARDLKIAPCTFDYPLARPLPGHPERLGSGGGRGVPGAAAGCLEPTTVALGNADGERSQDRGDGQTAHDQSRAPTEYGQRAQTSPSAVLVLMRWARVGAIRYDRTGPAVS